MKVTRYLVAITIAVILTLGVTTLFPTARPVRHIQVVQVSYEIEVVSSPALVPKVVPKATPKVTPKVLAPKVVPKVVPQVHPTPRLPPALPGCTAANWRSTMTSAEVWIDSRESSLDPLAVNASSGARGLGQLEPSTYRNLGITPSWNPCEELIAQRAYIRERYGTEDAAIAFWRTHRWY